MAVLKILKDINNKQHREETQQASAATMAATDSVLLQQSTSHSSRSRVLRFCLCSYLKILSYKDYHITIQEVQGFYVSAYVNYNFYINI